MPPRDDLLAGELERALGNLPEVDLLDLRIRVAGGIAHLDGVVRTLAAKEAAERAARSVSGIVAVDNRLAVEEPFARTDTERTEALTAALAADPLTDVREIGARVQGGVAVLVGHPDNAAAMERAAEVAATVPGISSIIHAERIAPKAPKDPLDLANRVADALDLAPGLEAHTLRPLGEPGGIIRLVGHVADEARRRQAEEVARSVDGVREVINELEVAPCGEATAEAPPSPRTDTR
ncbi:MAG: BON domain-containing protein [Armatimonadetes bacterium]|nr:BON domain-containing protein [Armatimonadota bacterium]